MSTVVLPESRPVTGARAERAIGLGLAGLLLLATLGEGGGHPTSMMAWHGALVGLLLLLVLRPRAVVGSGPVGWWAPALGLFLWLVALGVVRAPYRYGALLPALELAACLGVAWIAARAGGRGLATLAMPLQIGAAIQGCWVVVEWLALDRTRPCGTFLNPNHLALWMVAVSLLALGGARVGDGRWIRFWRVALVFPAAAAVVLAGSRGAALGLVAGAGWLAWSRRRALGRGKRVVLLGAVVLVLGLVGWRQLERIERYDPFRHQRFAIWSASLGAVAESPWWGSGPGQFATAAANLGFPDRDGPLRFDRAFTATHSDLLRLPAEFGVPAALAALAALGLAAGRVARRRRRGTLPPLADGAVAALIAVGAQALVDNPSRWPAVYLLTSALLGCLLSEARAPSRRPALATRGLLACALLVVFAAADVAPFLSWRESARLPLGPLDPGQLAGLRRSLRWNPVHPDGWQRLAVHLSHGGARWDLDAYAQSREAAERAVRLHPRSAQILLTLARVEARACRTLFRDLSCRARVATAYGQAEARARHDPFVPLALAAFLLDTGEPAGARRAAERALALEPEAALPRLLLADVFIEEGSPASRRRAAALLAEARRGAATWEEWEDGAYGRELLRPAPEIFERLERKLAARGGEHE